KGTSGMSFRACHDHGIGRPAFSSDADVKAALVNHYLHPPGLLRQPHLQPFAKESTDGQVAAFVPAEHQLDLLLVVVLGSRDYVALNPAAQVSLSPIELLAGFSTHAPHVRRLKGAPRRGRGAARGRRSRPA